MKTFPKRIIIAMFVVFAATGLFIAFNGEYTVHDAFTCVKSYFGEEGWRNPVYFPVGVTSQQVKNLPQEMSLTGGNGITDAGDAMAIYITPDIFPIASIVMLFAVLVSVTLWLIRLWVDGLIQLYSKRNQLKGVSIRPES